MRRLVSFWFILPVALLACRSAPVASAPAETFESRMTSRLQVVLQSAVRDSAFPGAIAVVGNRDGVIARFAAGQLDRDDDTRPDAHTAWDMASLTKVFVTTTLLMQLIGDGRVALDSPVVRYLPDWNANGTHRVTVRHLLTHSSGLPAWRPLWKETGDALSARTLILETAPDTLPGARYAYSDIGFMLLGMLVERVMGDSLQVLAQGKIFGPARMNATFFRPDSTRALRFAPTEHDPWRGRHLRGEVHDENAYRLDGVSGHAGLFSTAQDAARFAQLLLRGGELDGVRVVNSAVLDTFARLQDSTISHRALGWEKPNGSNSAGDKLSASAFGHTGFTGTSIWIDPGQDFFVILLTNRVNPTRENRRISGVRRVLADSVAAVIQAKRSDFFLEGRLRRH